MGRKYIHTHTYHLAYWFLSDPVRTLTPDSSPFYHHRSYCLDLSFNHMTLINGHKKLKPLYTDLWWTVSDSLLILPCLYYSAFIPVPSLLFCLHFLDLHFLYSDYLFYTLGLFGRMIRNCLIITLTFAFGSLPVSVSCNRLIYRINLVACFTLCLGRSWSVSDYSNQFGTKISPNWELNKRWQNILYF